LHGKIEFQGKLYGEEEDDEDYNLPFTF